MKEVDDWLRGHLDAQQWLWECHPALSFRAMNEGEVLAPKMSESSSEVGCSEPGPHLHVRRREDVDGGATKSLDPRIVPADDLVVFCLDQYLLLERAAVGEAPGCDRLLVNLGSGYRGRGMTPGRLDALLGSLSRRAGLQEAVTPHR